MFNEVVITFHEMTKEVSCLGRRVGLTRKQFEILLALHDGMGSVCSREELLAKVWGRDVFVESRTIDRHVVQLRRKLKSLGLQNLRLDTVWGIGYRLQISGRL